MGELCPTHVKVPTKLTLLELIDEYVEKRREIQELGLMTISEAGVRGTNRTTSCLMQ